MLVEKMAGMSERRANAHKRMTGRRATRGEASLPAAPGRAGRRRTPGPPNDVENPPGPPNVKTRYQRCQIGKKRRGNPPLAPPNGLPFAFPPPKNALNISSGLTSVYIPFPPPNPGCIPPPRLNPPPPPPPPRCVGS